ncbi:class I SAM-dependent methyltransferase [Pseudaestuariivita rosea]|uniref:class I SAM-dependent methyltransferase n=1 Tax=Pseudaestuariivita rosea TaxID=2763263 RepID=UPI001ABB5B5B|nr:class I SAM-dependent methyltransferase [Pseudaestuariivita rosea]
MSNADQAEYWAAQTGWVAHQKQMDLTLAPVLDLLLKHAALRPGERVLDIGCGTGNSTLAAAAVADHVTGLDISPTLLDLARTRAVDNVSFTEADAQTYRFRPDYDAVISRFGVMFFNDTTAAFRNILTALKPGGRLTLTAWGPPHLNPWFMEPAAVAAAHLGDPPKTDRTLPGPFAFENADRVLPMFGAAGVQTAECQAIPLTLAAGSLPDAAELCTHIGPARRVLNHFEGSEDDRLTIRAGIADVFAKYDTVGGLQIPAVINLYTGQAPA